MWKRTKMDAWIYNNNNNNITPTAHKLPEQELRGAANQNGEEKCNFDKTRLEIFTESS